MGDESQPPLTDEELKDIRNLLEADRRVKWAMAKVKAAVLWLAAVVGAFIFLSDAFVKFIKALVK